MNLRSCLAPFTAFRLPSCFGAVALLALAGPALVGCAEDDVPSPTPGSTESETTAPSEESADPGATPAAAATSYTYSCQGQASAKEAPAAQAGAARVAPSGGAVGLRCAGGVPGTRCGTPEAGPCGADDARFAYEAGPLTRCGVTTLWVWDGSACVGYPHQDADRGGVAVCTGSDCPTLPTSQDACEAAHATCGK